MPVVIKMERERQCTVGCTVKVTIPLCSVSVVQSINVSFYVCSQRGDIRQQQQEQQKGNEGGKWICIILTEKQDIR